MKSVFVLITLFLLATTAMAQSGVTVTGVVEDETGAVIPTAKLTLTKKGQTDITKGKANEVGIFSFQNVLPGKYILRGEAKNFEAAELSITVTNAPLAALKLKLNVAAQLGEITVSGSGKSEEDHVSIDRNADRLNFDQDLMKNLPTDGQNILPVLSGFLAPAAQGNAGVSVVVDGVEGSGLDMPAGAMRRARINRNPYAAEFSRPGKGRVEVATEEGSLKRYHASVGMYYRNSVFDARNPFALTKPEMQRKLFEGRLAGPLVNKKIGFFLSAERLLNDESAIINARKLNGAVVSNVLTPNRYTSVLSRVDVRAGDKHTVNLLYTFRDEADRNRGIGGLKLSELAYDTAQQRQRLQIADRMILSSRWLNDLRVVVDHGSTRIGTMPTAASIVVLGAFTGGAQQRFQSERETSFKLQDIASYTRGSHTIKFGGEWQRRSIRSIDGTNFGGTFEFSNLNQFAAGTPFVYRINQGQPSIRFSQHEVYGFVQDEIKLRPNLSLTPGVRYAWQSNLRDGNNVAPRIGFAYGIGAKTVVRGGIGIFYDRLSASVTQKSLLNDGTHIRETVIQQPTYPTPNANATQAPPSVIRLASDLRAPYVTQASVSVERELWKKSLLTVEYQSLRGVKLLRSRNINAPVLGVRPTANFFNINQVESSGSTRSNSLSVSWRGNIGKRITGMAQYTYAESLDNTSGTFYLPANNYDLSPEWGRADFDTRHRLSLVGTVELPANIRVGTFVTIASGVPYNLTTGFDNNGDSLANDRPFGVARNAGFGPGLARVDLRITKSFKVPRLFYPHQEHQGQNLEISLDIFNLLNTTNFNNFIGVQTSPFFGRANSAQLPRTIQLSGRYRF